MARRLFWCFQHIQSHTEKGEPNRCIALVIQRLEALALHLSFHEGPNEQSFILITHMDFLVIDLPNLSHKILARSCLAADQPGNSPRLY